MSYLISTGDLVRDWTQERPRSAALATRARAVIPGAATHDGRYLEPYPLYFARASGSRKWDVDGIEYVDFWMGHGALLLGHSHPSVVEAIAAQVPRGSHYGGAHELEVRWAEIITNIVPSGAGGGVVKFLSSGTEATLMAMRLARAFTRRDKILKIQGHFHGWNDYATFAMAPPFDEPISAGIPRALRDTVSSVPRGDAEAIRLLLESDPDVAALIMIPDGGEEYLRQVREITRQRGVLLIFDEVVTGFRYAPGGAQELYGVVPDLTALAKILAGGLPGGAVVGRADIMSLFDIRPDDEQWTRHGRINHPGTFNANPLSAAAGVACLEIVKDPAIQLQATATADRLRAGLNEVLVRRSVPGTAAGQSSIVRVTLAGVELADQRFRFAFRMAMHLGGVDVSSQQLIVSVAHSEEDIARTIAAFEAALGRLRDAGYLPDA